LAKPEKINSTSIISALQAGEVQVLETLYMTYRNDFFRWGGRRFQATGQDFEDAWQEAVLAFYEQVRSGKLTSLRHSVRTWLFAVGYKRLVTYNRKIRRIFWKDAIDEVLFKETQAIEFLWDEPAPDEWALIGKAMQSISPQCREILVQRFYEGKKIPDIKAMLGHNSENTTSATLSRCLRKLKETVLEMLNEER
jgi:RNA polymerase sigma factor (sigma-70 family)